MSYPLYGPQPCPFCSGQDPTSRVFDPNEEVPIHFATCARCTSTGPWVTGGPGGTNGEQKALEAWDKRTDTPQGWLNPEIRGTFEDCLGEGDKPIAKGVEPCPFCGNRELMEMGDGEHIFFIHCNTCEAKGPYAGHPDPALRAWNKRA